MKIKINEVHGNVNNFETWVKSGKSQLVVGIIVGITTSYIASGLWQFTMSYLSHPK